MAKYLPFRKIHEDERRVGYTFGYPEMNRRLVIDKVSLEGRPVQGMADSDHGAVLRKILQGQRALGRWPEAGAYAA